MQDEINEKVIALSIRTTKLTAEMLQKSIRFMLSQIKKQLDKPVQHHGKQTLKQLKRSCRDTARCCICPVRSYCVSWSFVILVFRVCTLSICPRRPESRESIRRRYAAPLHRNRTSPPSLWPGRELRKYHCPQHLSSPPPGAARLLSCKLYRSPVWGPRKVMDFVGRGGAAQ